MKNEKKAASRSRTSKSTPAHQDNTIETDVLIVGGGLSGLTAAMGLRESGLRALVLEKTHELGGRARSWADPVTGDPVHIGPHIFLNRYPNMFRLMDLCGTRDRIVWQEPGHFITQVDGQQEIRILSNARLPAPVHFTPSLFADKTVSIADMVSALPLMLYTLTLSEDELLRLDNINASAFLRGMGVSEYMIERFWAFSCMAIMNVPIELCSAGALLRFFSGLVGVSHLSIGFPDTGLSDLYVPQCQKMLKEAGIDILMNTGVKQLLYTRDQISGAELEDGRIIKANTVISALTPQALRLITPKEWLNTYKVFHDLVHFQPSPYLATYLWFDRKLTDQKFWARTFNANDLNCDFYDMSNINRGWEGRNSVIMTNCIWCERAAHMTDEEIARETQRELAEYLPEAARAKVDHFVVNRIPMAIHCPYPGMEQRRPTTESPVKGLLLAGDWIGTGIPSCMENACFSGWLAAEAVLAANNQPQQLAIPHGQHELEGIARAIQLASKVIPFDPISRLVRSRARKHTKLVG